MGSEKINIRDFDTLQDAGKYLGYTHSATIGSHGTILLSSKSINNAPKFNRLLSNLKEMHTEFKI